MRKLFVLIAMSLLCVSYIDAKTFVVAVGISDYPNIGKLKYTENDVDSFCDFMKHINADITVLKGESATHVNIIKSLRLICGKCSQDDAIVLFFSGHGYEGGFCCYDMRESPGYDNEILNKKERNSLNHFSGGISYKEIQILFQNCRAVKKMVFADACFSAGLSKGNKMDFSAQSMRLGTILYMMSSRGDETSFEMPNGPNGWFTYFLVSGLKGKADINNNGKITIQELFDFVYNKVSSATQNRQHPEMLGRINLKENIF